LSPIDINTLILTHRHIDHSSDINALAEGMTLKSREPRGAVLVTADSIGNEDAVLLKYITKRIAGIGIHEDGAIFEPARGTSVESVIHSHHGVQCFGLIFRRDGLPSWGFVSDTASLECFPKRYAGCSLMIINTALKLPRAGLDHMSLPDAESLAAATRPDMAILTHLGNDMLDTEPEFISSRLPGGVARIIAAFDGMTVDIEGPKII
jgi:phosphoribosyl 1,2-cyclic phosphodiesterase